MESTRSPRPATATGDDEDNMVEDMAHLAHMKQRSSILWLVSKACNNYIPPELRDPYYRDHDGEERLKPQIVQSLASAEMYCLVLANIYQDPNYNTLSHSQILSVLMRKGIYVQEPHDSNLTETVLVQTAPVRMSAHMVIVEALMSLYIKEVLIPEKVVEVVNRFYPLDPDDEVPDEPEDAAVFWINKCCAKFKEKLNEEFKMFERTDDDQEQVPTLPPVEYLWDLSDGCSIASVLAFYCPDDISWHEICYNEPMSLNDSIYNLQLVQFFCQEKLPCDIFFITVEEFLDCHRIIRPNILCFIADLLYHFEIRTAPCVRLPTMDMFVSSEEETSLSYHNKYNNGQRGHGHNGSVRHLRELDMPTPAEMKAMSLQHFDWMASGHVSGSSGSGESDQKSMTGTRLTPVQRVSLTSKRRSSIEQENGAGQSSGVRPDLVAGDSDSRNMTVTRRTLVQRSASNSKNNVAAENGQLFNWSDYSAELEPKATPRPRQTPTPRTSLSAKARGYVEPENGQLCQWADYASEVDSTMSGSIRTPVQSVPSTIKTPSSLDQNDGQLFQWADYASEVGSTMSTSTSRTPVDTFTPFINTRSPYDQRPGREIQQSEDIFEVNHNVVPDVRRTPSQFSLSANRRSSVEKDQVHLGQRSDDLPEADQKMMMGVRRTMSQNSSWTISTKSSTSQGNGHQNEGIAEGDLKNSVRRSQSSSWTIRNGSSFGQSNGQPPGDRPDAALPVKRTSVPRLSTIAKSTPEPSVDLRANEELTRYFSALDIEADLDNSPELVIGRDGPLSMCQKEPVSGVGFVIGSDAKSAEPDESFTMSKKKEMIMIQILKRRQEQERKRIAQQEEIARKREEERSKREEQERKKEEEKERKKRILEEYQLKKLADMEADNCKTMNIKPTAKDIVHGSRTVVLNRPRNVMPRPGSANNHETRPRPKSLYAPMSSMMSDYVSLDTKKSKMTGDSYDSGFNFSGLEHMTTASARLHQGLPTFQRTRSGPPSDGASECGSTFSEYTGPKLFVKPTQKSNRGIITNAINVVLAGKVHFDTKKLVLEAINGSDSKHFVILFRGAGLQFRSIYSYCPDREDVVKLHGVGPKVVYNDMIDKFYKYNSGTKSFNVIQTKHMSVTIDAFTIQNTLWQTKKQLPASGAVR
ncbi:Patronin [Halotydeus destructor]|nr:Patronin [Halotydeus destructor]